MRKTSAIVAILFLNFFVFSCVQDETKNDSTTVTNTATKCQSYDPASYATFRCPWQKEETALVIDTYQGNSIDWNKMATDPKIVGIIHRASIGQRIDTMYASRREIARERGYLWGAYHLGYRGNTIAQADLYLSLVENDPEALMILDLENTTSETFMTIAEAVIFMEYIYEKTGRIPIIYANHSTTKLLNQNVATHPLFQQSKLWYARFKDTVIDFPVGIWSSYFLWQFSSEINCFTTGTCLYNVPGTRFDIDVNVFNGTPAELRDAWNNN